MNKCIVMLSGGLDSRLALKIMQERGFEITALFFKLPFGTGCCNENCSFNFSQLRGVELKVFDCTRGNYSWNTLILSETQNTDEELL